MLFLNNRFSVTKKRVRSRAILRRNRPNATCIIALLYAKTYHEFQNLISANLSFRFGITSRNPVGWVERDLTENLIEG